MESQIKKIINDNTSTDNDIIDLIYMLVDHYNLEDYVKDVQLETSKHLGCYRPDIKQLAINLNNLLESSFKTCVSYSDEYRLRPERMYMVSILSVIYHEIYHAIQTKEADSSEVDTLHYIIKEGIELGRRSPHNLDRKEKLLFDLYYSKILIERSAEIFATYSLLQYRNSGAFTLPELGYLRDYLNQLINSGYIFNRTPVKTYYKLRGKKHEYDMLDFNDKDYDLFTRFAWGFPVERELVKTPDKFHLLIK